MSARIRRRSSRRTSNVVFVSYDHDDARLIHPIVDAVGLGGSRVFLDRRIAPGEQWRDTIDRTISECSKVVVFWCCHSARSPEVNREIALAVDAGKPIVPYLLCREPVNELLSRYQWIDASDTVNHACRSTDPTPPRGLEEPRAVDLSRFLRAAHANGISTPGFEVSSVFITPLPRHKSRLGDVMFWTFGMLFALMTLSSVMQADRGYPYPATVIAIPFAITLLWGLLAMARWRRDARRAKKDREQPQLGQVDLLRASVDVAVRLVERGELEAVLDKAATIAAMVEGASEWSEHRA
jgi:hypothetical protein